MKQFLIIILGLSWFFFTYKVISFPLIPELRSDSEKNATLQIKDTCIIEGLVFEIIDSKAPNKFKADVKNGRIHILDLQGNEKFFRVIRYVFSVRSDDRVASVRSYGDLVSYPVLQILKEARIDEPFYFEEIIIVDEKKEILNSSVRPIIIKRIAK